MSDPLPDPNDFEVCATGTRAALSEKDVELLSLRKKVRVMQSMLNLTDEQLENAVDIVDKHEQQARP